MRAAAILLSLLILSGVALGDRHLGPLDGVVSWLRGLPWPGVPSFAVVPECAGFSHGPAAVVNIIDPVTRESVPELVWTLYLDCGGEVAEGLFPLDSLTSEIGGDGWLASEGFTLRVKGTTQTATYSVVNDGLPVYGARHWNIKGTGYTEAERAASAAGLEDYRQASPGGTVTCENTAGLGIPTTVARVEATKGHLSSPTVTFSGEMELETDSGRVVRATVGSGQGTARFMLDNKSVAVASWNGNLVTGTPPPDPRDVVVIRDLLAAGQPWMLASAGNWDNYLGLGETCQATSSWAGSKHAAKSALVAGGVSLGGGNFDVKQTSYIADLGRAKVVVPVLTLRIRGSLLGVRAAIGAPVLSGLALQPAALRAGESGQIAYTLANADKLAEGAFQVGLKCDNVVVGVEQRVSVAPGGRVPGSVPVSWSSAGLRSCVLSACPRTGDPTACSRQTLMVDVLPPVVCTPGLTRLEGLTVYQCAADGSGLVAILQCSGDTELRTGPINDPDTGGLISTGTFVRVDSVPDFKNGVWSCSGGEAMVGTSCQALPGTVAQQVAGTGCRFVCDTGGLKLPLAVEATVGTEVVNLQQGTWRQVGCEPPRPAEPVSTPIPTALLNKSVRAPAAGAPAGPSRVPEAPGFEAVFAIVGLIAVGVLAVRVRGPGR